MIFISNDDEFNQDIKRMLVELERLRQLTEQAQQECKTWQQRRREFLVPGKVIPIDDQGNPL